MTILQAIDHAVELGARRISLGPNQYRTFNRETGGPWQYYRGVRIIQWTRRPIR